MAIQIRKLDPSEWQKAKELRLRALQQSPEAFGSTLAETESRPDQYWIDKLQESLEENTAINLYAELDGELVGMMVLYWQPDGQMAHVGNVVGVFVDQNHREKGIGKQLLVEIIRLARTKPHLAKLELDANSDNTAAIKLYKSVGFVQAGLLHKRSKDGDVFHDHVLMELMF